MSRNEDFDFDYFPVRILLSRLFLSVDDDFLTFYAFLHVSVVECKDCKEVLHHLQGQGGDHQNRQKRLDQPGSYQRYNKFSIKNKRNLFVLLVFDSHASFVTGKTQQNAYISFL